MARSLNRHVATILAAVDATELPHATFERIAGLPERSINKLRLSNNPKLDTMERITETLGLEIIIRPKERAGVMRSIKQMLSVARSRGCIVPPELEPQWQVLKQNHFSAREAAISLGLPYFGDQDDD